MATPNKKLDPQTIIMALIGIIGSYMAGHFQIIDGMRSQASAAKVDWAVEQVKERTAVVADFRAFKSDTKHRMDRMDSRITGNAEKLDQAFARLDRKIDRLTDAILDLVKKNSAARLDSLLEESAKYGAIKKTENGG